MPARKNHITTSPAQYSSAGRGVSSEIPSRSNAKCQAAIAATRASMTQRSAPRGCPSSRASTVATPSTPYSSADQIHAPCSQASSLRVVHSSLTPLAPLVVPGSMVREAGARWGAPGGGSSPQPTG